MGGLSGVGELQRAPICVVAVGGEWGGSGVLLLSVALHQHSKGSWCELL